jgi:hypothetical protein
MSGPARFAEPIALGGVAADHAHPLPAKVNKTLQEDNAGIKFLLIVEAPYTVAPVVDWRQLQRWGIAPALAFPQDRRSFSESPPLGSAKDKTMRS